MARFSVVRADDGWSVLTEGRAWGRFQFRIDAEEAALRLADRARAAGREAEVFVPGVLGEMVPLVA